MRNLIELARDRKSPEALLSGLVGDSGATSIETGEKLIRQARDFGLNIRDYLTLAIDPSLSEKPEQYSLDGKGLVTGYEASLAFLRLPVRDDLKSGVVLELASDTFTTFPGTRALFPEVVDDLVKWKYRQENLENATALVGQSRTISGVQMISTVVDDAAEDYQYAQPIAESGRIPIRNIKMGDTKVGIWKHGVGYKTTYEFQRRASLDLLTPYAARTQREIDISKVKVATSMLISGDAVHAAAPVVAQSSYASGTVNGTLSRQALLMWLVDRAKNGAPIDIVVGNWDAYIQWLMLFAIPTVSETTTEGEILARQGFQMGGVPILTGTVNFALSSSAPANKLIGYSKADTLEELVEANSLINESERSMRTQEITYYKTENVGYRLVFGDTRSILNYGA